MAKIEWCSTHYEPCHPTLTKNNWGDLKISMKHEVIKMTDESAVAWCKNN